MFLGLVTRASSEWRCVIGIGDQGVVWVALCHSDCWAGRRVGGAVSLGLLGRASCGRCCAVAALVWVVEVLVRVVVVLVRVVAVLVRVVAVVRGRVLAGQNGSFLKAGLVQNRHFWAVALVTACQVMSRHVTSRYVTSRRVASCRVISRHVTSRHVISYHVMSCHVISRFVMS